MKSCILSEHEIKTIQKWVRTIEQTPHHNEASRKMNKKRAKNNLPLKYNIIGIGYNRIVFDLKNGYVLKVPIRIKGNMDNYNEFILYRHSPLGLKKHLAEIIEYNRSYLIMKKIRMLIPYNRYYNRKLQRLKVLFSSYGIVVKDLNRRNVKLNLQGRIVFIDYGNFIYNIPENIHRKADPKEQNHSSK